MKNILFILILVATNAFAKDSNNSISCELIRNNKVVNHIQVGLRNAPSDWYINAGEPFLTDSERRDNELEGKYATYIQTLFDRHANIIGFEVSIIKFNHLFRYETAAILKRESVKSQESNFKLSVSDMEYQLDMNCRLSKK